MILSAICPQNAVLLSHRLQEHLLEARIDTSNATSKIAEVVDEVVSHLSGIGANVKVTLTVEAKSVNPFSPALVRTIGENAHNLGFDRAEFS